MQTTTYGKKQYFTLLGLSLIFILLLPLAIDLIDMKVYLITASSVQTTMLFLFRIINIFCTAGGAVLTFAYIRYNFKLCLPFIGVTLISILLMDIVAILFTSIANKTVISFSTLASALFQIIISCAIIFINLGIAKSFAKHIKNEIVAVSLILLVISILSLIQILINYIRIYFLTFVLNKNPNTINWSSFYNVLFNIMPRFQLPSLIYNYVYMFVAYLILLAVYDKRHKLPKYFSKAKTAIKKLWDKTADEIY